MWAHVENVTKVDLSIFLCVNKWYSIETKYNFDSQSWFILYKNKICFTSVVVDVIFIDLQLL